MEASLEFGRARDPIDALFDAVAMLEAAEARLQALADESKISEDQSVMVQRVVRLAAEIVSQQAIVLGDHFHAVPVAGAVHG